MLGIRPVEQEKPYCPAKGFNEMIEAFRDGLPQRQEATASKLKASLSYGPMLELNRVDLFNLITIVEHHAELLMKLDRIKKLVNQ